MLNDNNEKIKYTINEAAILDAFITFFYKLHLLKEDEFLACKQRINNNEDTVDIITLKSDVCSTEVNDDE